jgi:hypothetical protein
MGMREHGMVRYSRPPGPLGKHEWYLFVDDGRDDILWLPPKPNACWLIDTHLGYEQRLRWAQNFDQVFLAQLPDVERMREDGVPGAVHWLPLACSPYLDPCYRELAQAMGRSVDLTRVYDCAFVGFLNHGVPGNPRSHNRLEFLDLVLGKFKNSWLAFNVFFEEAAKIYVRARVGLNVSICDDLNMRFFEGLSYGVCQVCNSDMVGLEDLGFEEGVHYLGWRTEEEALEKIQWALEHPGDRELIAEKGLEAVRQGHTYEDRVRTILRTMRA